MEGPHLKLTVEKGPAQGNVIERKPGTSIRVGRVIKGNNFTIKDDGISSKHLLIDFKHPKWLVSDLDTSNGTFLNALPLKPNTAVHLKNGDLIKIGQLTSILVTIVEVESKPKQTKRVARRGGKAAAAVAVDDPEESNQTKGEVEENAVAPSASVDHPEEPKQTKGDSKKVDKNAVAPSASINDIEEPKQTKGASKKVDNAVAPSASTNDVEEPKRTRASKRVGKSAVAPSASFNGVEEPKQAKGVPENVGKTMVAPPASVEDAKEPDLEIGVGQIRRNPRRRGRGKEQPPDTGTSLVSEQDNVANVAEEKPVRRRARPKQTAVPKNEPLETLSVAVSEMNMVGTSAGESSRAVPGNDSADHTVLESSGSKKRTSDPKKPESAKMTMERLQKMTLGEWFDFMEVYLVQKVQEETNPIIEGMEAKAEQLKEYFIEQQKQKTKS